MESNVKKKGYVWVSGLSQKEQQEFKYICTIFKDENWYNRFLNKDISYNEFKLYREASTNKGNLHLKLLVEKYPNDQQLGEEVRKHLSVLCN